MNTILSSFLLATAPYIEIPDLANLPLLSPDLERRETAKIVLPNGLQVFLISDPQADKSAAVASVNVGSWSDPEQYPGMAHFCEHMLFMGTEKYPDTNEFSTLISDSNGLTNAFTAPDKTVYMFSSQEKGFFSLLDRFAHFFIDPIFDPSNISREMHAVDQEFALMKENDGWRGYMVFKETGNKNHPNHLFSAGNSKTLSKIPQNALKTWHRNHYGANQMRVAIYSSLPLDMLKKEAAISFAGVPTSLITSQDFSGPLTSAKQKGHITSIEPIQNQQMLSMSWELPPHLSNDDSKSAGLVAYTLQRGQKYSLLEHLKSEKLVDDIRIQVDSHEGKDHAFFEIDLVLSNLGMQNIDAVIGYVFQAIEGLKTGVPKILFSEKNALAKLNYQYQTRIDAFQYISQIGRTILHEDFASFPRKTLLAEHFSPKLIRETFSFLTPDQCSITVLAPQEITKAVYDKQEKWLQVPYTVQKIPESSLSAWREILPHPDIRIADANPFVPTDLSILPMVSSEDIPTKIVQSEFGVAYYARCPEYETPEASVHLHILTPELTGSPRSAVLASLYLDHLTDQLGPTLLTSTSAGITSHFEIDKKKIHLTLSGFSEKIPLLLQEITLLMSQKTLPTQKEFDLYFARHEKGYENSTKVLPVKQARELLSSLLNQDKTRGQENLIALRSISFEDFCSFYEKLFEKTYFEVLFAGNILPKTVKTSWENILAALSKSPYLAEDHPQIKALHLPDEEGPFLIAKETNAQGNAAILLIDEGDFSPEKKAAQKILASALQEPFFDTLRTKQKTGYIAQSSDTEFEKRLYQFFLVQSNTHQPEDLLHRFELFLEEFREDFGTIVSEKRFETLKESAIATLLNQCRNIEDKSSLWDLLAFQEKGDFSLIERRLQAYQDLSYEQFTKNSLEFLSRANRKRLAILYTGKIPSPFAYTQMTTEDLSKVATYAPRPSDWGLD